MTTQLAFHICLFQNNIPVELREIMMQYRFGDSHKAICDNPQCMIYGSHLFEDCTHSNLEVCEWASIIGNSLTNHLDDNVEVDKKLNDRILSKCHKLFQFKHKYYRRVQSFRKRYSRRKAVAKIIDEERIGFFKEYRKINKMRNKVVKRVNALVLKYDHKNEVSAEEKKVVKIGRVYINKEQQCVVPFCKM